MPGEPLARAPGAGEVGAAAIEEIVVADPPATWEEVGFRVEDGACRLGAVRVRLAGGGAERGILGWSLRGLAATALDGLPTSRAEEPEAGGAAETPAPAHPNGAVALDHVVAFTPDLERTVRALQAAGLDLRRVREGPTPGGAMRQAFFRLSDVILEVIEQPRPDGGPADRSLPAKLWGIALRVESLEGCARHLGDRLGSPRDAVQPGRRIATLRREAGLSVAIAFIT